MKGKLIPKPHMLKSIRARNWNLSGAIEEHVDNALGHGQANDIQILIDNNHRAIVIQDNGIGLDDIDRLFWLGDASEHDNLREIGLYGVGGTQAGIWLGDDVTVTTIHKGWKHTKHVNWAKVEKTDWPDPYVGPGVPVSPKDKLGTNILIRELAKHHYHPSTCQKLAEDLGHTFSPALQCNTSITIHYHPVVGSPETFECVSFVPSDLTDIIAIEGQIETEKGPLHWYGRAGLSVSLPVSRNGVNIAFGHRIIERGVKDAFNGTSAPTLYCEVFLDENTPWKYSLAEHKDKVVSNREELMKSIHEQIAELLKRAEQQSRYLALKGIIAPIETNLTMALKGAGILHIDPNEKPDILPGVHGDGHGHKRGKKHYTPVDEGDPAKESNKPSGIKIDFRDKEQLEGKLFDWDMEDKLFIIYLDEIEFQQIINFPPSVRDETVIKMLTLLIADIIGIEWLESNPDLVKIITPGLYKRIEGWANGRNLVAPYLSRELLEASRKAYSKTSKKAA